MMRAARFITIWVIAAICGSSVAQQPLPNLQVDLDGQPVVLAPVMLELNTYLVPLRESVRVLTNGQANLSVVAGESFDLVVDGLVRVRIPSAPKSGASALVFGPAGPSEVLRRVPVETYPYEITPKGGQPTTFVDVELLCSSLGISVDLNQTRMSLLSPDYWCMQLGIPPGSNRLIQNLKNLPDFGISPPARTILCWLRPSQAGFAQAYRIEDGKPEPILGENALGDLVDVITSSDTPRPRSIGQNRPLRFETYNYGNTLGKTVSFVSIVTTKDLGDNDPIAAIKAGDLKDDEWAIVGLRQRVVDMPVLYENVPVKAGEDVSAFAERNKNSPSIIRVLNGLRQGESLTAGTKLCVMVGLDENRLAASQSSRYQFKGLYEVQNGDTVASLAESWGVATDDILAANPAIPPGGEPLPGDLLNIISQKDGEATKGAGAPTAGEDTTFQGSAVTLSNSIVRETSLPQSRLVGQIPANKFVEILGKVRDGESYRVRFNDLMGFVDGQSLRIRSTNAPSEDSILPGPDPSVGALVARESLKYLGTPYQWGGNSLTRGIDCSHYVAQIYQRIGWKEPPPPVIVQETIGPIVHCKPGPARRAGKGFVLPDARSHPYGTTNMQALSPGDRIIFQRGNTDASGSRHTGIYIGKVPPNWQAKFGPIPYAFAHASSSRGVTVGSLTSRYYWNIYRFTVRSQK